MCTKELKKKNLFFDVWPVNDLYTSARNLRNTWFPVQDLKRRRVLSRNAEAALV